ncbi:MAG: bifunctional DedA family/phosphatase PAP2 family protein [Deltaproteobacteria bacterium]|nr:bifunctional DedA family/phosphatase PAP2 family protein [Deltaproteobacteria bacterium]
MTERILDIISLLGNWGYLIVFLAAFLESSAFLGLLVPGESIVIIAGVLSSQGYLDLTDCIIVTSIGAVLGDTTGYTLGQVLGRGYFERHGRLFFIKAAHIEKADRYFREHGGKTIFFGRFIGFLRAMAPFAAGMSRMPYGRFLAYNFSGAVLWAVAFTLLGYFFGLSWGTIEQWAGRAGVFVFFILLVAVGFGYLYRALVRRQAEISSWFNGRYNRLVSSPFVTAFVRRHPALAAFLTERLSPGNYLGVHLTAGLLASAVFVWILARIMEDVITGEPLTMVDQWVLYHIHYFRTPSVSKTMEALTLLGGALEISVGGVLVFVYLIIMQRRDYAAGLVAALLGGVVLDLVLKTVFFRLAPVVKGPLIGAAGSTFPSPHALISVIFYGMVAYFLVRDIRSWRRQVVISLTAVFIVLLIGFTKIYLQVHFLSDVMAGYAGGLFWLTVCITGLEVYRKKSIAERPKG